MRKANVSPAIETPFDREANTVFRAKPLTAMVRLKGSWINGD
jgi:hypothetical protein